MKIYAGIVTYNPDDIDRLERSILSIAPQVNRIIIVDNGSNNYSKIEKYCMDNFTLITIIRNKNNLGIAKALNQIFDYAKTEGADWVLTLDQDSVCPNNMIESFLNYSNRDKIGIICPRIVDDNDFYKVKDIKQEYSYLSKCITSGSLTNVLAWSNVGGFDEQMFIDFVDFEFCIKVVKQGYKIIRDNKVHLQHQLGNMTPKKIFGIKFRVTNHSIFRNYYYGRNAIYVLIKHKKFKMLINFFERIINICLFEDNKILKFKSIFDGIKDVNKMFK